MDNDADVKRTVVDEIAAAQRKDRSTIKADAELMQSLMKHPGWARYLSMIEAVSQNFYRQAMKPLENTLEVTKSEYAKGTLNGLSAAAQLPSAKIREYAELTKKPDAEG